MIRSNAQVVTRKINKPKVLLLLTGLLATSLGLTACENQKAQPTNEATEQSLENSATNANDSTEASESADTNIPMPKNSADDVDTLDALSDNEMDSTRDKEVDIDWQKVNSGVKPVAESEFNYPFELDSNSVKSQADFSNITNQQAQHSLTVGMASNEPLERILNQLGDSYLSHEFSASEAKLIIYTTPNVKPSQFEYVIEHEFAHGLTLPIEVMPLPETQKDSASNK